MTSKRTTALLLGAALWFVCVVGALVAMQRYAGQARSLPALGAAATTFLQEHRKVDRPLLVMVIHPRCPCTDASLAEFGDLLARSRGACDALLLEFQPNNPGPGWPAAGRSRQLGGVEVPVIADRGGGIAASLGAVTSGHIVMMDARGAIGFHGGITLARGHRGRSPAQDAMLDVIRHGAALCGSSLVYGCSLAEPELARSHP